MYGERIGQLGAIVRRETAERGERRRERELRSWRSDDCEPSDAARSRSKGRGASCERFRAKGLQYARSTMYGERIGQLVTGVSCGGKQLRGGKGGGRES
jgi:hypothetical protein